MLCLILGVQAYTEAEGKRLAVLEALKKSDAAKHRQQAESAQRSAKIQLDTASAAASAAESEAASPTDQMAGDETAPTALANAAAAAAAAATTTASLDPTAAATAAEAAGAAEAAPVAQAAAVGAEAAAAAAAGAVGATTAAATATATAAVTMAGAAFPQPNLIDPAKLSHKLPATSKLGPKLSGLKSPPKSPTKSPTKAPGKAHPDKKPKKQQMGHRKRKGSTKATFEEDRDAEEAVKTRKVRVECSRSQPGFGWLNHTPCQISRVLGRRTRALYGNRRPLPFDHLCRNPQKSLPPPLPLLPLLPLFSFRTPCGGNVRSVFVGC